MMCFPIFLLINNLTKKKSTTTNFIYLNLAHLKILPSNDPQIHNSTRTLLEPLKGLVPHLKSKIRKVGDRGKKIRKRIFLVNKIIKEKKRFLVFLFNK